MLVLISGRAEDGDRYAKPRRGVELPGPPRHPFAGSPSVESGIRREHGEGSRRTIIENGGQAPHARPDSTALYPFVRSPSSASTEPQIVQPNETMLRSHRQEDMSGTRG